MKKKSDNPFLHIGRILLIVLALPFVLAGLTAWAAVLIGKAAAEALGKKHKTKLTVNG